MSPTKPKKPSQLDKFKAAARRAECDTDEAAFEAKLKKLAETKPEPKKGQGGGSAG